MYVCRPCVHTNRQCQLFDDLRLSLWNCPLLISRQWVSRGRFFANLPSLLRRPEVYSTPGRQHFVKPVFRARLEMYWNNQVNEVLFKVGCIRALVIFPFDLCQPRHSSRAFHLCTQSRQCQLFDDLRLSCWHCFLSISRQWVSRGRFLWMCFRSCVVLRFIQHW